MESEDLFISEKEVRVRYVFRNTTDHDIETVVAFPLPPIPAKDGPDWCAGWEDESPEAYNPCSDNPVRFTLKVDGRPASFATDRRPLPPEDRKHPNRRNEIFTYHWTQRFAAGKPLVIEHSYRAKEAIEWGRDDAETQARLRQDFCVGTRSHKSLLEVMRILRVDSDGRLETGGAIHLRSLQYILKTARTWDGPIGRFHLTIEKRTPNDFVSLCLDGLKRTSSRRYELETTNYVPASDLAILFVARQ